MRAVTLELPTQALVPLGLVPDHFFERYEELELVETLGLEPHWRLQVLRLRSRAPLASGKFPGQVRASLRRSYGLDRLELLESRPATRDRFFLVRQRNPSPVTQLLNEVGGKVFPGRPFLLRERVTLASFRGDRGEVDRVLRLLRQQGIPFRLRNIRPGMGNPPPLPPSTLTDRQRHVLEVAHRRGFYTVPRKVSLTVLARSLGMSPVALGKLLRRAEASLVGAFLSSSPRELSADELNSPGAPARA